MLNRFTKMLLVATSLAPILLVMAVDDFFNHGCSSWDCFSIRLLTISASLVVVAWAVMYAAKRKGSKQDLSICKAKNSDKEVLTFLLAYLLPILNEHKYLFRDFNIPTLSILVLISIAVYHSNAFDFNPLLGMLGYHFYEVEDDDKFPYILISSSPITRPCQTLNVVKLFDYTFLHIGETE